MSKYAKVIGIFIVINLIFLTAMFVFTWIIGFALFVFGVIGKIMPEPFVNTILIGELIVSLVLSYFTTRAYVKVEIENK